MIGEDDRQRMLRAHSIGSKMVDYLDAIGIKTFAELATADVAVLALRINAHLRRRHINRAGIAALQNLIARAKSEA